MFLFKNICNDRYFFQYELDLMHIDLHETLNFKFESKEKMLTNLEKNEVVKRCRKS